MRKSAGLFFLLFLLLISGSWSCYPSIISGQACVSSVSLLRKTNNQLVQINAPFSVKKDEFLNWYAASSILGVKQSQICISQKKIATMVMIRSRKENYNDYFSIRDALFLTECDNGGCSNLIDGYPILVTDPLFSSCYRDEELQAASDDSASFRQKCLKTRYRKIIESARLTFESSTMEDWHREICCNEPPVRRTVKVTDDSSPK